MAAVHSGWRGAAADIVAAAVDRFRNEYGVAAEDLRVALGPSISGPRYEVGEEVIDALASHVADQSIWRAGRTVDLRAFLVERLKDLGVRSDSIHRVGGCTADSEKLASYRRDGASAGRQYAMIYRPVSTT